ncbi:MAG TPA: hypothetical protein VGC67_03710 [Cellulomonas sp.]
MAGPAVLPPLPEAPVPAGGRGGARPSGTGAPAVGPGAPGRHLLALPDGIGPDEVEVLAMSRFPASRWERPARLPTGRRASGAARGAAPAATAGVLRLGRLSTLTGPYALDRARAARLGLPAGTTVAFVVDCPRERAPEPVFGGDRDGLRRAFGQAAPVREEGRVLRWLVAVARRLGGAVRTDGGVVLEPEMDAALDLTVLTDRWAEPERVLAAVRRAAPQARIDGPAGPGAARPSPTRGVARTGATLPGAGAGAGPGVADEAERRRLHAEAAAFDAHMRAHPPASESFGVLVELGPDGFVLVEVAIEHEVPTVLAGLPWTQGEVVAYQVRWTPPDVEELAAERPSLPHRVARGRAAPVVRSVARELQAEVGGEIADLAGFLVDPAQL